MSNTLIRPTVRGTQRGFTLIEALVALAVVAFGLLSVAGVQMIVSRNNDVAKQRSEATRLAQERLEALRSFTTINTTAGQFAWNDLANGNDTVTTNAAYTRTWTLAGATGDAMRRVSVNVAWTDRAGEAQSVTLNSYIAKVDPADSGALGFPLPNNTTLKRPKNRNLNIPVPALDLGDGRSVYQLSSNFAVVFSNDSGYVVMQCNFVVTTAAQLSSCTEYSAYILAGYISLHSVASFPATLGLNTASLTGTSGTTCSLGNAINQNTGATISGYKYYLCVVAVNPGGTWSGLFRLSGMDTGTNYLVCRFQFPPAAGISANQRNVQPYVAVGESLDSQNYLITDNGSCPTISGLSTTLHQNCRSSNPSRTTDCPAT